MATLTELLSVPAESIEPPKALPQGSYHAVVDGNFVPVESQEKRTPGVQFNFRLLGPMKVHDEKALAEAGGCVGKSVKYAFYVTEDNRYFLKQFLTDHLGIDPKGKEITEMVAEAPGKEVVIFLKNMLSRGSEPRVIHVVDSFAKL
jgi:hypothetical protein